MNSRQACKVAILLSLLLAALTLAPVAAQPTVELTSTTPERGDPLEEITLNLTITNTTDEAMWSIRIWLDLSGDEEGYFTALDEYVDVEMGEKGYISPNESISANIRIVAGSHTPAKKHLLPLVVRYRSGACEGGCQSEEYIANIAVPIYRQDPKVAITIEDIVEVFPGEQLIVYSTLNNFGTGLASGIEISASTSPVISTLETSFFTEFEPPELGVSESVIAVTTIDTTDAEPGYYQFTVGLRYEDKYGNSNTRVAIKEFKIKGTATQEALSQANQLKELGVNAYQIKDYTTAISYLERAIELYERLEQSDEIIGDIALSEEVIQLSTTNIQAVNYYQKGDTAFAEGDYNTARMFYSLARDIFSKLGNTKSVSELSSKISACDDEIYKYELMDQALYVSAGFCIIYGILAKRKEIAGRLKRE